MNTVRTNVNIGTKGDIFVLTEEQRHKLMDYNRQWLLDPTTMTAEPPLELGTSTDMRNTTPTTCDDNTPADDKNS